MKKNIKALSLPQILIAAVAVIALAVDTYLLYFRSFAPLALVFAPIAVALIGGAVLVLVKDKFFGLATALSAVALIVDTYLLNKHSVELGYLSGTVALLPALISVVVDLLLVSPAKTKESVRKFLVSLKRNPQYIPLIMMLVTFLLYSLNLTDISDTTAKIQAKGMGLSEFCIMLFSLLCMVCMLNAFPRRKKANIPMVVLMFAMFIIIIFCDVHYQNAVLNAVTRKENPITITEYISAAYSMLGNHKIMVIVTAVLVALLPVYSKLLKKINTSVAVEDNGEMAEIEIDE